MPTPSFSKDITSIFNSNDLKDDLKYDITCRLVCEALEVATVSMLIYDPRIDQLRCKGNYIAPQARSRYLIDHTADIGKIIENICVFEYFDSEISNLRNSSFQHFKKSIINGETNKNYTITEIDFNLLKSYWINNDFKKKYTDYKVKIHTETHSIDNSTISGRYFSKLLGFGKKPLPCRVFQLYSFVADVSQPGLVCRVDSVLICNTTSSLTSLTPRCP